MKKLFLISQKLQNIRARSKILALSLLTKYPFCRALVIMHNLPSTGAFLREEGGPLRGG